MALFITFEGGEGCGKSTQTRLLYKRMLKLGLSVLLTMEPGGTSLGNKARRWLKQPRPPGETEFSPLAELFLFAASRAQLVSKVIDPGLKSYKTVICDRYTDSTLAYQGYGRGLDLSSIQIVNNIATQGLIPDLIILLDIPVDIGLARKGILKHDRFEREENTFHHRVRQGYLEISKADPQRWLVVDAMLSKKEIERIIWGRVEKLLQINEAR